jgi:hypothetical protein
MSREPFGAVQKYDQAVPPLEYLAYQAGKLPTISFNSNVEFTRR